MIQNKKAARLQYLNNLRPSGLQVDSNAAEQLNRRCEHCDALLQPSVDRHPIKDTLVYVFITPCNCPESEAAAAKVREDRAVEIEETERKLYQYRLDRAGLVGNLALHTFDNFVPNANKQKVQEYTKAILTERQPEKPFLYLYGQYGTGKTHLAAACLHTALDYGMQTYFRVWPDYLAGVQATWGSNTEENEHNMIRELQRGDLVCIDDLDKRPPTDWVRSMLFPIINYRYNRALPTIITLNYGPYEDDPKQPGKVILQRYLGSAVLDRLLESSVMVEFSGASYRSGIEF